MPEELYSEQAVTPPSNLFAGDYPLTTESAALASGEGVLAAGQLLGRIDRAAGAVTADPGNTGDGAVSGFALGVGAQVGEYQAVCNAASADGGTFSVFAPDGSRLADAEVGVAYAGPIAFTIGDGAADWALGDTLTLDVDAVTDGKWRAHDAAATDGSQHPRAILAADVDATSADVTRTVYRTGHFRASALTGYSAGLRETLAGLGIYVQE